MDYYGPMVLFHSFRIAALTTVVALTVHSAWAQTAGSEANNAASEPQLTSSPALDAELFYEIFLGELSARTGDPGAGYAVMLEAARRSADGQLYKRAADIALQSRSGEYALAAAKAWKEALPQSREANRYVLQILIALNRIGETGDLLRQELAQAPPRTKAATLAALPQMYGRASEKVLAAKVVESALVDELAHPATGPVAWVSLGRLRLAAGNKAGALQQFGLGQLQQAKEQAEINIKYKGYIEKEKNNADKLTRLEDMIIPDNFNFDKIQSISIEAKQKLNKIRPRTIAQASRISGVSPSDISVLLIYMGR